MKVGWQPVVVIGIIALGVGAYAVWAGQNEMNYIKSCEQVVACGGGGQKASTQFYLTPSQENSLRQGQIEWIAGIIAGVAGVACVVYGVYLHPERRRPVTIPPSESGQMTTASSLRLQV